MNILIDVGHPAHIHFFYPIVISSEIPLPQILEKYRFHLPPEKELEKAKEFIQSVMKSSVNDGYQNRRQKLLSEKDNIVDFIVEKINVIL